MSPRKPAASRPIALYFAVVCVGYAIDLATYVGMVAIGAHLYFAFVASFVVGTICNVLLLRRYFATGRHSLRKDLTLSLASNGMVILLAMAIYVALMSLLGLHHLIAKILANGISFLVNYRVRRSYF